MASPDHNVRRYQFDVVTPMAGTPESAAPQNGMKVHLKGNPSRRGTIYAVYHRPAGRVAVTWEEGGHGSCQFEAVP